MGKNYRIAILSAGLEKRKDKGYENSSYNLFQNIKNDNIVTIHLYKGSGTKKEDEYRIPCFSGRKFAVKLGYMLFNDHFGFEYFVFGILFTLRSFITRRKYDTIYTKEPMVMKTVQYFRKLLPGTPKLIYAVGITMDPVHFIKIGDKLQILNIELFKKALSEFPDYSWKFNYLANPASDSKIAADNISKEEIRKKYNIKSPFVLISVGTIDRHTKRMDYVISEATKLNSDWTLVLCGKGAEPDLIETGRELLGERFLHLLLQPAEIGQVYKMSDVLVLASLKEGFPNVLIEAMQNKISPILHRRELYENALKSTETLIDMTKEGELSSFLSNKKADWFKEKGEYAHSIYKMNYDWDKQKFDYYKLLEIR